MDAYEIHDGRFLVTETNISAADALVLETTVCPVNRVRTYILGSYTPSATETRTVHFCLMALSGNIFSITQPVAIALGALVRLPLLTMGMELKLFPGDKLRIYRDVATAASTMTLVTRYFETDLPYYSHVEPQRKVVSQVLRHGSIYRGGGGGGGGGPLPGGGHGSGEGGGGGEPQPY